MREQERRGKPVLDDQEVQEIERALVESYNKRCTIDLIVFNPFEDEQVPSNTLFEFMSCHIL
ncbi:YolD-like family protein [Paenibacillus sp. ALJ109b]|uniref:YolD-like family protein n=1 Tax=Paenibacillus sp. ALJ109b TaxID=2709068 RepID=UPI0013D5421B|nr:YolD-like family protein [Paenibacillus sp. ALJ109b]NEU62693.1 YolD-like family protein [Paenibacillus sp. ALJ109b]